MKAPEFSYVKPGSLGEVFDLLDRHGDRARVLAGGQSLLASLNLRLSEPELLVDITGVPGLSGIAVSGQTVRIGALTTHRQIETSAQIARHLPLLAQAVRNVAHAAIRNVGTFGGSIALADPAAEYPACAVALDATFVLAGRAGERRVKAREFFRGLYETALNPGELVTAGEFPLAGAGYQSVFLELARRHGDYAIVGLAAHALVAGGRISDARLAFLGAGSTPVLAVRAAAAIEGRQPDAQAIAAAQATLAEELEMLADLYSSRATKLHLARVLLGRALGALAA
ncbi:MAG: molybdopterin dehydrogenase [Betaproteobacteria bacterium RIFCSPLOWO2_12_FULL_64_23]|nr:MAG: molybdopterin dehydrogenase [Betaproteobacteria bacterium RIFCSPLOWO2_12_FULL_64_23]